jgi:hypothetical protein
VNLYQAFGLIVAHLFFFIKIKPCTCHGEREVCSFYFPFYYSRDCDCPHESFFDFDGCYNKHPNWILSGFIGGKIDAIFMRIVDGILSFPDFILAIAIAGVLGPSLTNIVIDRRFPISDLAHSCRFQNGVRCLMTGVGTFKRSLL